MTIKMLLAAVAALALVSAGTVQAETKSDKPAAAAPKANAPKAKAPRSAKSIDCSKQADAKGLHGKERRKFRSKCRRG